MTGQLVFAADETGVLGANIDLVESTYIIFSVYGLIEWHTFLPLLG